MTAPSETKDYERLITSLAMINFADRYYALCSKFGQMGPSLPPEEQRALVNALDRGFVYDKREKFFGYREAATPDGIEFGLNVNLREGAVELVLVCRTSSGHIGEPFSVLALDVKRLGAPTYRHSPAYPQPEYADKEQAAEILTEALDLYDAIRTVVARGLG